MFVPDDPVRQILADLSDAKPNRRPAAIICAPHMAPAMGGRDTTSTRVEQFLKSYEGAFLFTTEQQVECGKTLFHMQN